MLANVDFDDESKATILAALYGPICLDPSSSFYLGSEVTSNNTAELTAIGEALLWLSDFAPVRSTALIRYDSEYAAKSVQGIFNG